MAMVGICCKCGGPATSTCGLCGKLFCERCMDRGSGVCLNCVRKRDVSLPDL